MFRSQYIIINIYLLTANLVLQIQMREFHSQNSGLYLIHARVEPLESVNILLRSTIVRQGFYSFCQLSIVGTYGTSIAKGAEVFAWIETERGSIAPMSSTPSIRIFSTMRLCRIFQNAESMVGSKFADGIHVAKPAVEVYRKQATRAC